MRSLPSLIVLFACSCLLLLQLLGVHVHVPARHAQDAAQQTTHSHAHEAGHDHHAVVSDHHRQHAAEHFDGDVADQDLVKLPGKSSFGFVLLALIGAASLLVLLISRRSGPPTESWVVPVRRHGNYLLPPSQAPPLTL